MSRKQFTRLSLFVISSLLGTGLFVFLIIRQGPLEILSSVEGFGVIPFIGFVVISLTNFSLYSIRWQLIINKHLPAADRISLPKMYMHRMGGYAMGYLTQAQFGGEPVRVALLAQEKNVSVKAATSSAVLDIAFELTAFSLFIMAGVVLAVVEGLGDSNSMVILFAGLTGMSVVLTTFFALIATGRGFFSPIFRFFRLDHIKRLKSFEQSIIDTEKLMGSFLSGNRLLVVWISLLSALMISFRVVEALYLAYFFHADLNFAQAFLISTLPGIALLLPIPAGIGVFEGGFAAVFTALAITMNPVAFAFIIRGRDLVFLIIGSAHILFRGTKFLQNKILKPVLKQ